MSTLVRCLAWVGISFLAAVIGSVGTFAGLGDWYNSLIKPSWTPPSWLFGPVWTALYTLMGISMGLMDSSSRTHSDPSYNRQLIQVFTIQIILNALWPLVFFGAGLLWLGLFVILALELFLLTWIRIGWRFSRTATLMIVPYAAWVGFASCLNAAIAWRN